MPGLKLKHEKRGIQMENKTKFYQKTWFMWIMLVIFAPIGIALMWIYHKEYATNIKIILSVVFGIFFVFVLLTDKDNGNDINITETTQSPVQNKEVQEKKSTVQPPDDEPEPTIKPTDEPKPTIKPTVKPTVSPTKKPSKKARLRSAIVDVIEKDNLEAFNYVPDNNFSLIKFKGSSSLTNNMTIKGMYQDMFNILKAIQPIINTNVDFNVVYPLTDQYGNTEDEIVIKATFKKKTIKKINFDNAIFENIPIMADEWWNHNAVIIN